MNERFSVQASTLGNYFGVGFITPQEQLEIDLGRTEQNIDEASQDRMDLGNVLEDAVLNYFENKLSITITDRNDKKLTLFDGAIRGKLDGMANFNGIDTVIECKVSNSKSGAFIDNKAYHLQCQAYMGGLKLEKCILLGLQNGKPEFKMLEADQSMISDINEMATTVSGILMGVLNPSEFPWHLVEKYNASSVKQEYVGSDDDENLIIEYTVNAKVIKDYEERQKEIQEYFKANYELGIVNTPRGNVIINEQSRKGGIDTGKLLLDNPELNLDNYEKEPTRFKTIRITAKK